MQAQARAPTTIRPAAVDPLTAPRVVTLGQIPAVVARSATALRARPQTDVRSAWSSAVQNPANQTLTVRLPRQRLQNLRPEPGRAQRRVVHRDGSAAMSDNAAVTRALNAARVRTCFDPSVRSPDRLGSRAPLSGSFLDWKGLRQPQARRGARNESSLNLDAKNAGVGHARTFVTCPSA